MSGSCSWGRMSASTSSRARGTVIVSGRPNSCRNRSLRFVINPVVLTTKIPSAVESSVALSCDSVSANSVSANLRAVMSWTVPEMTVMRPSTRPVMSAVPCSQTLFAIRRPHPEVSAEGRPGDERLVQIAFQHLAIGGIDVRQHRLDVERRRGWVETEQPAELIGPLHRSGGHVEIPAPELGKVLRLGQPRFPMDDLPLERLVHAPRHEPHGTHGEDEPTVDRGPLPRVLDARLVVEHHRRIDDAGQAVLEHDVADRDQQWKPVLVERDDADHHEVREVHLDPPVEQVHQHR